MNKQCFCCGDTKPLSDFYKHSKMKDGHLNKCKTCTKTQARERYVEKVKDPAWLESERKRGRLKYYRLGYKGSGATAAKKKWEATNPYKKRAAEFAYKRNGGQKGTHLHHWSYREKHWDCVFRLSHSFHRYIHSLLNYDKDHKQYRIKENGMLLDTRLKHQAFLKNCEQPFKQWQKEIAAAKMVG